MMSVEHAREAYLASHDDVTEEELLALDKAVNKCNADENAVLTRLGVAVALLDDGKQWPEAHRRAALRTVGLRKPRFAE